MPEARATLDLVDLGGRTKLINRTQYATEEALQSVLDMGVIEGANQTWDHLDGFLAKIQSERDSTADGPPTINSLQEGTLFSQGWDDPGLDALDGRCWRRSIPMGFFPLKCSLAKQASASHTSGPSPGGGRCTKHHHLPSWPFQYSDKHAMNHLMVAQIVQAVVFSRQGVPFFGSHIPD